MTQFYCLQWTSVLTFMQTKLHDSKNLIKSIALNYVKLIYEFTSIKFILAPQYNNFNRKLYLLLLIHFNIEFVCSIFVDEMIFLRRYYFYAKLSSCC